MNLDQIISDLIKYKAKIIKRLSKNEWEHFRKYFLIKKQFPSRILSEYFRDVFCNFYRVNPRLNRIQKNELFRLLSQKEDNLKKILEDLYEIPGHGARQRLFLSFGTKLLHTIDNDLPIYDRNIAHVLMLTNQSYTGTFETKIKNRLKIYEELKKDFSLLLKNPKIISFLKDIRHEIHKATAKNRFKWKDNLVSDTKLLDSSLWAYYDICYKI